VSDMRHAEASLFISEHQSAHDAPQRKDVEPGWLCDGLAFLGIELEEHRNAANKGVISMVASRAAFASFARTKNAWLPKRLALLPAEEEKRRIEP